VSTRLHSVINIMDINSPHLYVASEVEVTRVRYIHVESVWMIIRTEPVGIILRTHMSTELCVQHIPSLHITNKNSLLTTVILSTIQSTYNDK
jgi:hypothetical protein